MTSKISNETIDRLQPLRMGLKGDPLTLLSILLSKSAGGRVSIHDCETLVKSKDPLVVVVEKLNALGQGWISVSVYKGKGYVKITVDEKCEVSS